MEYYVVKYLGKIIPNLGLFTSANALETWILDNDAERADHYEAVPITLIG